MDIQNRIKNNVGNLLKDELGDSLQPDKLSSIVSKISEKIFLSVNPDELVLLGMKEQKETGKEMAVVSVIGEDSVGIVADVTRILAENKANIEGMNQAIVSGYFALILSINVADMDVSLEELQTQMNKTAEEKNLKIYIHHQNIFKSMNRI